MLKLISQIKHSKLKIISMVVSILMILQCCFFCPCIYAAGTIDDLCESAAVGDVAAVSLLLESGVDPNQTGGQNHSTPLVYAALEGCDDCIRLLIEKGADPNQAGDHVNSTPLMYAAANGRKTSVQVLLEKGANPNHVNDHGRTALIYAAIRCAKDRRHKAIMRLLLEGGANPNQRDMAANGMSPLHSAAWSGYNACVCMLLEKDACPDLVDNDGNTPLHFAACEGKIDCVRSLLEKGAKPNYKNSRGKTPLDICCTGCLCDKTNKDAIEALLKAHGGKSGSQL